MADNKLTTTLQFGEDEVYALGMSSVNGEHEASVDNSGNIIQKDKTLDETYLKKNAINGAYYQPDGYDVTDTTGQSGTTFGFVSPGSILIGYGKNAQEFSAAGLKAFNIKTISQITGGMRVYLQPNSQSQLDRAEYTSQISALFNKYTECQSAGKQLCVYISTAHKAYKAGNTLAFMPGVRAFAITNILAPDGILDIALSNGQTAIGDNGVISDFDRSYWTDVPVRTDRRIDFKLYLYDYPWLGTTIASSGSAAFGRIVHALGQATHAQGRQTTARGDYSHAEGRQTIASAEVAHTQGYKTRASQRAAHAQGCGSQAIGSGAHAQGGACYYDTSGNAVNIDGGKASGHSAHAEGQETLASGKASHAEGRATIASGQAAHSEGCSSASFRAENIGQTIKTESSGKAAHAEGLGTLARGEASHTEGRGSWATGDYAHAEGAETTASNVSAHAEGAQTEASGMFSHAENAATRATGYASHAEGQSTVASGNQSHTEGSGTIAASNDQHVQGRYNKQDATNKYAHIVGGGTSDSARRDIHTLDWNGNAWFAGNVASASLNSNSITSSDSFRINDMFKVSNNGSNVEIFSLLDGSSPLTIRTPVNTSFSIVQNAFSDTSFINSDGINDFKFIASDVHVEGLKIKKQASGHTSGNIEFLDSNGIISGVSNITNGEKTISLNTNCEVSADGKTLTVENLKIGNSILDAEKLEKLLKFIDTFEFGT